MAAIIFRFLLEEGRLKAETPSELVSALHVATM
jgi:hypothetical protein